MYKYLTLLAVAVLTLCAVPPVSAQTIKNPTGLVFMSPDHATVTSYEIDFVRETDKVVVQTLTVPNSPVIPLNTAGEVTLALNVQPIAFGQYRVVTRAVAGSLKSVNSVPTDVFDRVPGPPSKGALK